MGSFNETVLITGASGFLGSNLCRRLVHKGTEVHAVSRLQRIPESGCMRWWQGDMADVETTRVLLGKMT